MQRSGERVAPEQAIGLILVIYVVLATAYNLADPIFEPPDERLHYDYIRYVQRKGRLPIVDLSGPLTEYHQPPLYYVVMALVTAPLQLQDESALGVQINPFWGYQIGAVGHDNKNQYLARAFSLSDPIRKLHLVRAFSTLFGCGTLIFTYLLAQRFVGKAVAAMTTAIVAFTPNFLLTSGAITNDSLLIVLAAASGWVMIRLVTEQQPPSIGWWAGLGTLLGLGMLTKLSAWPLLPVSALVVILLALRHRSWRVFLSGGAILASAMVILGGWWALRNLRLYGDLTGLSSMWAVWGTREPLTPADYRVELHNFRTTFWANFGYGNVPLPNWVYHLTDLFALGGLAGLIWLFIQRLTAFWRSPRRDAIIVAAVWSLITLVSLIWYLQRTFSVTGRQLYPILPVIGLGLAVGWDSLVPSRWRSHMAYGISSLMVIFAVGALVGVLIPAYRPPPRLPADRAGQTITHRLDWRFGEAIVLLGYDVDKEAVASGETVSITLYWKALEKPDRHYTVFVHLFGEANRLVGARDTYPGLGKAPTGTWQVGEIIIDTIPVPVDVGAQGPILLDIEAGLYDLESGQRLPIFAPEGSPIAYPVIGTIKLTGQPAALPAGFKRIEAEFEGGLRLEGYRLDANRLTLYWSPAGPLAVDYTVFVHVVDEAGQIVAQGDGPPRDGRYPTTVWGEGERFEDTHLLTLPEKLGPGSYDVLVGLYNPLSNTRLPLVDGRDHVRLENAITVPDR